MLQARTTYGPWPRQSRIGQPGRLAEESTADHTTHFHAVVTDVMGTPTELVSTAGDIDW
ncbi:MULTISPECIES: hypothetical protein [unclassified Streptomyces]|uniref:hypothetical protein n=1 Tax=unclassified Streptomyces TaxID=2593676 RepID=UPI0033309083